MSENFDRDAVLRRIQKLLAIAQDDRANPNEASAAAGMAERIIRKYQFEHANIIMTALKKGDDLGTAECMASAKTNGTKVLRVPSWAGILAVSIAKFTDCGARSAYTTGGEACIRFYGYTSDVQVAQWMFDYLVGTTLRLCNDFKKTPEYIRGGRPEVNSYRRGVSIGIINQINKLIAEKAKEVAAQAKTGFSLVVVKQQAITEKYGNFGYVTKKHTNTSANSFGRGFSDGKQVDVSRRAVGQNQQTTRLN